MNFLPLPQAIRQGQYCPFLKIENEINLYGIYLPLYNKDLIYLAELSDNDFNDYVQNALICELYERFEFWINVYEHRSDIVDRQPIDLRLVKNLEKMSHKKSEARSRRHIVAAGVGFFISPFASHAGYFLTPKKVVGTTYSLLYNETQRLIFTAEYLFPGKKQHAGHRLQEYFSC